MRSRRTYHDRLCRCGLPLVAAEGVVIAVDAAGGGILGTRVRGSKNPEFLTTGAVYTEDLVDDGWPARCTSRSSGRRSPTPRSCRSTRRRLAPRRRASPCSPPPISSTPHQRRFAHVPGRDGAAAAGHRRRAVRRRAGRRRRHRGPLPGEDAAELVDGRLRPAAGGRRPERRATRRDAAVPRAPAPTSCSPHGRGPTTTSSPAARSSSPRDRQPAGRRRADGGPRRRSGVGRGRPAHRLDAQPGRAGHAGDAGRAARPRPRRRSGSSPPTSAARSAPSSAPTPSTRSSRWPARRSAGRSRWVETRSENMVAMAHGRAQVQTVTIGGDRDGTHHGLPPRRAAGLPAPTRGSARCCRC